MTNCKQLIQWALGAVLSIIWPGTNLLAQSKLSIDKVYSAYLRNSGTIVAKGQIKGYFFLYVSDKIDRHTDEYTLQILDENLNKVQSIKFQDSKNLNLLESAYNGNSISFLFKNEDTRTLDMKVYDFDGKLKYTYSRELNRRTDDLMKTYDMMHTADGMNKNVFDIGNEGYVSVIPTRERMWKISYEVDYYASDSKKQWTYIPNDDAENYAGAQYLGCTDSLIILEVLKRNLAYAKFSSHLVGINFITKKKQWEIDGSGDQYNLMPSSVVPVDSGRLLLMASYYDKNQNIITDFSRGLAVYEISTSGKVLTKTYNSWAGDIGQYLPANAKGKIDNVGYLFIHKYIRTPDNRIFVVGEGYNRQGGFGNSKIIVTDLVMMEFNGQYKLTNATIYEKATNKVSSAFVNSGSQMMAMLLKADGAFDYAFTTGEPDNSTFDVCYSDWDRSSENNPRTFNSIRYNGKKFTTDKIDLKSNASTMLILPAKPGSIMIIEYYKKDKRLDLRLEKLG